MTALHGGRSPRWLGAGLGLALIAFADEPRPGPTALPPAVDEDDTRFVVPLREVSWAELSTVFDPAWCLPDGPARGDAPHLVRRAAELAASRWPSDDDRFRCLGDLVAACEDLDRRGRAALLAAFRRKLPVVWSTWGELVEQILMDDGLRAADWDPDDDADDDGLFLDRPWSLAGTSRPPWRDLDGNRDVHQAVALVRADLEAIKAAENDYATYPGEAGAEYEAIHPVDGRHVRAAPREGAAPQVATQLFFRVDLPFPFGDYECLLRILNRVDAAGHLVTDIYSTSPDFHWMAGRDVFVPLTSSSGAHVAMLVVRWLGFDLDGVPDGTGARRAGLRAGLGRLKRRAERAYARVTDGPRTTCCAVPPFAVRGDRRWRR